MRWTLLFILSLFFSVAKGEYYSSERSTFTSSSTIQDETGHVKTHSESKAFGRDDENGRVSEVREQMKCNNGRCGRKSSTSASPSNAIDPFS